MNKLMETKQCLSVKRFVTYNIVRFLRLPSESGSSPVKLFDEKNLEDGQKMCYKVQ